MRERQRLEQQIGAVRDIETELSDQVELIEIPHSQAEALQVAPRRDGAPHEHGPLHAEKGDDVAGGLLPLVGEYRDAHAAE